MTTFGIHNTKYILKNILIDIIIMLIPMGAITHWTILPRKGRVHLEYFGIEKFHLHQARIGDMDRKKLMNTAQMG